jgi:D-3-phosphoglycerate dehydrogenase
MRYRILTLNNISALGLERLPRDRYEVATDVADPHGILVRSADMHEMKIPDSVLAVARAGAGVNNIPVPALSRRGVPVFNAPGANANAVKELVLAGIFMAARNVVQAWSFARSLQGSDEAIDEAVEKGKKKFVGFELPGEQALSLDDLFARSEIVTVHVPQNNDTRGLVNAARLKLMKKGGVILNFARAGIVDSAAVTAALDDGRLHAYICDFPTNVLKDHPKVVTLPHLGASTGEAEENCAVMAAETLRDFLENGNIRNSVNFPEAVLSRAPNASRLAIANSNVPNMVGQISTCLATAGLNIADLLNKSRGEYAYTLIDADGAVPEGVVGRIKSIDGVLSARLV